jgi:hypothetical protein
MNMMSWMQVCVLCAVALCALASPWGAGKRSAKYMRILEVSAASTRCFSYLIFHFTIIGLWQFFALLKKLYLMLKVYRYK